jgi:hypothetical protein
MTPSPNSSRPTRETPLEEGLRRFAPKEAEARRIAISDFVVSLLMLNHRRSDPHSW